MHLSRNTKLRERRCNLQGVQTTCRGESRGNLFLFVSSSRPECFPGLFILQFLRSVLKNNRGTAKDI